MSTIYVALDLETTGLDPQKDAIIEIGAAKFSEKGILDQFETLVNPQRPIPPAVQSLTGITDDDVRHAPTLDVVAGRLVAFLGDTPLVGHNIAAFDALFLDTQGIGHSSLLLDSHELAFTLLPGQPAYNLRALAALLGVPHPTPHRALPDALAAMGVFQTLLQRAVQLPPALLALVDRWLTATSWSGRLFFREALEQAQAKAQTSQPFTIPRPAFLEPLKAAEKPSAVAPEEALALLATASVQPQVIPNFEEREEQQAMARAVAQALNHGQNLLVEAGTGIGKSLAYLIPAALYALRNDTQVVVSTNTINLQEQLTSKDIPALQALLFAAGVNQPLGTATLKGRRHYLCLRRFAAVEPDPSFSEEESRLMARLLLWLTHTETGDKAELNLSDKEETLWRRFNAESASGGRCSADNCPYVRDGTCFLLRARRRAEAAHLVVVNHALLLADVAVGGHLLPPYRHLVIDEAHHLEDEATRQLGFSARQEDIEELLDRCQRLAPLLQGGLRRRTVAIHPAAHPLSIAQALAQAADTCRPRLQQLGDIIRAFLRQHTPDTPDYEYRLLINRAMRVQPDWSEIEILWENLRLSLSTLLDLLSRLEEACAQAQDQGLPNYDLLAAETSGLQQEGGLLLEGLAVAIELDDPERIVWFQENSGRGSINIAWAPLRVADLLRQRLYAGKEAIVFTGATLASQPAGDRFAYIRQSLGVEDAQALQLGSPFDFRTSALALIPSDMPEPSWPDYLDTMAHSVVDLTQATEGRTLCLFTSHSALRGAYNLMRQSLQRDGLQVLAQGIDGAPDQLLRVLRSNPRSVILGTSSFWEGIDVVGEALSLLIMARLPFSVPTEPVFAARAATYEDPFSEYALPQAVLRFKQGFGRLIRSRYDRGVMVVLDRRILSKTYGAAFLGSLPDCPVRRAPLRELPALVKGWLNQNP